jgi:DNA-binding transcriptional MerR regulator
MNPSKMLFTRQQISELTGVDDSTLNFWAREGVLLPASGGGGKGQHRRYLFSEVNLAAILNEIRQFGASLPALRSLADLFHRSLEWAEREGASGEDLRLVRMIQDNLGKFERHRKLLVRGGDDPDAEWTINSEGQIELCDWSDVIKFMKQSTYYRGETLKAFFEDKHFAMADRLDRVELDEHYANIRRIVNIGSDRPRVSMPDLFYRDPNGSWKITGNPTAGLSRSYIAIDLEQLTFDVWNKA